MWDKRFSEPGFAYGTAPNDFLVAAVEHLPGTGQVLSLGEGEGRNAVWLAGQGFEVTAVDSSSVGLSKATRLADEAGVQVLAVHADLADYDLGRQRWAGIVEIFCHLPVALRRRIHRSISEALKPGGVFLLEAYTPAQLQHRTGGPPVPELLYELPAISADLAGLDLIVAREQVRPIHEGKYHDGPGAVVQVIARKPS